jgi:hypothetical protein
MQWKRVVCHVVKSLLDFCDGALSPVNYNVCSVPCSAICVHIMPSVFLDGTIIEGCISVLSNALGGTVVFGSN